MRIHHLNCISSCPLGGHLMDAGPESVFDRGHLTNHCLLIEDGDQLVLVDTGFGLRDVAEPHRRLSEFFLNLNAPLFREELTAIRQIEKLGFDPRDVRHIVLTHLDFDHAGGLDDFPQAKVHMMRTERDHALAQKTWLDRQRFRPQQWGKQKNWLVYDVDRGEDWFGFNRARPLEGINEKIVMVPLIGHTLGHAGIAVQGEKSWLLNAGDAYFFHGEMDLSHPHCTPGLRLYQNMLDKNRRARITNQERLRGLKKNHAGNVEIFCAHDVVEFTRLSHRPPEAFPAQIFERQKPGPDFAKTDDQRSIAHE